MFIYFLDPKHEQIQLQGNKTNIIMRVINTITSIKIWPSYKFHTLQRWSTAHPTGRIQHYSAFAMQCSPNPRFFAQQADAEM